MFLGKHSNTWAWAALGCQRDFQVPPDYPSWDANTRFHGGSTVWSVKLEALDISGLQLHPPLATPVPLCPGLGEGLREPPTAQVCREALGRGASSAPSVCHCYKTAAQESRKQRAPSSQALGSGPSAQPRLSPGLSFLICMLPQPFSQTPSQTAGTAASPRPAHSYTHTHSYTFRSDPESTSHPHAQPSRPGHPGPCHSALTLAQGTHTRSHSCSHSHTTQVGCAPTTVAGGAGSGREKNPRLSRRRGVRGCAGEGNDSPRSPSSPGS